MKERFLIDECLSGRLVAAAKARGFQADYVTHLGKAGWQDWNLVRFAFANDYIVVTDSRRDFLKEYAKQPCWAYEFYSSTEIGWASLSSGPSSSGTLWATGGGGGERLTAKVTVCPVSRTFRIRSPKEVD